MTLPCTVRALTVVSFKHMAVTRYRSPELLFRYFVAVLLTEFLSVVQPSDDQSGSQLDFAKRRLQLAESLYFKTLEKIVMKEKQRLQGKENGQAFDFSVSIHEMKSVYSSHPLIRTPLLPKKSVLVREVFFGEREHYMYS